MLVTRHIDNDLEEAVAGHANLSLMEADLEIEGATSNLLEKVYNSDRQVKLNALIFCSATDPLMLGLLNDTAQLNSGASEKH